MRNNYSQKLSLIFETIRNAALAASLLLPAYYIAEKPELTFNIPALQALELISILIFSGYLQGANLANYFSQSKDEWKTTKSKLTLLIGRIMIALILTHLYISIALSTLSKIHL